MAVHTETPAKQMTRLMLLDACSRLNRSNLTYLGMPSDDALDIHVLRPVLKNVICIDEERSVLDNAKRSIASLALRTRRFKDLEFWAYLRDEYPREALLADVSFFDFYGGSLRKEKTFSEELAGLRSFFAKHARTSNRAFVLAWTYMPRDRGMKKWRDELRKILTPSDYSLLEDVKGVQGRSLGIRLLLRQSLIEHNMRASIYHHAQYKRIMSTLIMFFCSGEDSGFDGQIHSPDVLLEDSVWNYDGSSVVPVSVSLT